MEWDTFFPPGTPVRALPNWKRPRLYLGTGTVSKRWASSALYPSYRASAKLVKWLLRFIVATFPWPSRITDRDWLFSDFIRESGLGECSPWAVLIGTDGPAQKATIEFHSPGGDIAAYLKYGDTPPAKMRIQNEHEILSGLPVSVLAPTVFRFDRVGKGVALLLSPVPGRPLTDNFSLPKSVLEYIDAIPVHDSSTIDDHPWCIRIANNDAKIIRDYLSTLRSRSWAVLPQHGDFAPWNLYKDGKENIYALDWEYGTMEGFPGRDLAYYFLQTSALIKRWTPSKGCHYAIQKMAEIKRSCLSDAEVESIVRLTAYDAYLNSKVDGNRSDSYLQVWRKAVWEGA